MSDRKSITGGGVGHELVFAVGGVVEDEEFWKGGGLVYHGHLCLCDGGFGACGIEITDAAREFDGLGIEGIIDKCVYHDFGRFVHNIQLDDVFATGQKGGKS